MKSEPLFCWKRHVVFGKVSRHFCNRRVSFQRTLWRHIRQKNYLKSRNGKWCVELCENTCNLLLSHARIRAYIQEFLCFCCHKCHTFLCNPLKYSGLWLAFDRVLTYQRFHPQKIRWKNREKHAFCSLVFFKKHRFSSPFSSRVWYLWQQKINIAVGRRAMRVRARGVCLLFSPRFSPSLGWQLDDCIVFGCFW